jgi:hypothetical protein
MMPLSTLTKRLAAATEHTAASRQKYDKTRNKAARRKAWEKWNAAADIEAKIARAILKRRARDRAEDGMQAFAALALQRIFLMGDDEATRFLWRLAKQRRAAAVEDVASDGGGGLGCGHSALAIGYGGGFGRPF